MVEPPGLRRNHPVGRRARQRPPSSHRAPSTPARWSRRPFRRPAGERDARFVARRSQGASGVLVSHPRPARPSRSRTPWRRLNASGSPRASGPANPARRGHRLVGKTSLTQASRRLAIAGPSHNSVKSTTPHRRATDARRMPRGLSGRLRSRDEPSDEIPAHADDRRSRASPMSHRPHREFRRGRTRHRPRKPRFRGLTEAHRRPNARSLVRDPEDRRRKVGAARHFGSAKPRWSFGLESPGPIVRATPRAASSFFAAPDRRPLGR